MNTYFLSSIEDTIQWLAAPEQADPRNASRATHKRELAERAPQRVATEAAESGDLASQYLHEAGWEPDLAADVARQHWAAPYDNNYLVVTFHPNAAFKALDVVALSSKEDLSFDDLKAADAGGDRRNSLEIVQPFALKGKPWLTSISVSEAKAGGALYLHCFFVAKARPGEGAIARRVVRRKLFDACPELAQIENPHNESGVAQVAHPGIPPHRIPGKEGVSAKAASAAAQVAASASVPFQRLFLTLGGGGFAGDAPWRATVVINVEIASGQKPDKYDYIALALRYPKDAKDYYTWQWVSNLDQGAYDTGTPCIKNINSGLIIADLDKLEEMYIFYAGLVNNAWTIIGEPVSYKKQKHWMTESLPDIGQKRLHEIVIPGAHDVGTYDFSAPAYMNAQAQNLDFYGQLALGTRYFDCRLDYKKGSFYFYHGVDTYTVIEDLTKALKVFFDKDNSKDIVILDFCRFSNFDRAAYNELFDLFTKNKDNSILANAMMTPEQAQQLTINELVAGGKRLLILCEDDTARVKFNLGRSINIHAQWANTPYLSTLKTWLDNQVNSLANSGKLWALQAILTPKALNSIAWYAQELYPVLHRWVVNEWWNKANVVFCDFTAGVDLVNAVKVANRRRSDKRKGNSTGRSSHRAMV